MSAADIVTCPGCGTSRPLAAVREALAVTPSPLVACYMLPAGVMSAGAGGLPPHLGARGGCALVWLTIVDGRRVWAAEVEDIATIIDARPGVSSKRPTVCPWLTSPTSGRLVLEGRAKVPSDEARTLPTEARGMPVEWRREGDLWRFRIDTEGDVEDAWGLMISDWLGPWPCRFDRVSYEAPAELVDGDHVDGARLVLNDAGEPTAFALAGFYGGRGEEAADASAAIERVFGPAVTLAPWSPAGSGEAVAKVLRWEPNR